MIRYLLIPAFCALTGYTDKAVRRKIESGHWLEGQVWKKAPDGHILIDLEGFNKWVDPTALDSKSEATASASASSGEVVGVVKLFDYNRPRPTSPTPRASEPKSSAK